MWAAYSGDPGQGQRGCSHPPLHPGPRDADTQEAEGVEAAGMSQGWGTAEARELVQTEKRTEAAMAGAQSGP